MAKRFSILERIKSIGFALTGIRTFFSEEHNAYVHLMAAIGTVALGWFVSLDKMEWIIITLCIGLVFVAEIFNTSIEALANQVQPERDDNIKKVKDLAAAAVLLVAIMAVVVGLIIFLPKLLLLFN